MFVSFYSYKGGVGRTQLLVNAASYLCYYKHKKVLLLEWDLEAPGLHYYFSTKEKKIEVTQDGLIEILEKYMNVAHRGAKIQKEELPFFTEENIVKELIVSKTRKGRVDLIPCANYSKEGFTQKINDFDWREFTEMRDGNVFIDFLKTKLKEHEYDYIFIDSRTGIADYSGICNILLPDVNVIVVAPTDQNFEGALRITKAISEHPYLKEGNRKPFILPILSRIDNTNQKLHGHWVERFENDFGFVCDVLLYDKLKKFKTEAFRDLYVPQTTLLYNNAIALGENILFDKEAKPVRGLTSSKNYEHIANYIDRLNAEPHLNFYDEISTELLENWLEENEEDLENYVSVIDILREIGNLRKAEDIAKRGLSLSLLHKKSKYYEGIFNKMLGDIQRTMGNFKGSLTLFKKFYKIVKSQSDKDENVKIALADSYFRLGEVYLDLEKYQTASSYYSKNLKIREELYESNPNSLPIKRELAKAYGVYGINYVDMKKIDEATIPLKKSNKLSIELVESYPTEYTLKAILAISYQHLGNLYEEDENIIEALDCYREYNAIMENACYNYPNNIDFLYGLSISYYFLAKVNLKLDKIKEAKFYYEKNHKIVQNLAKNYDNIEYKKAYAISYYNLAIILIKENDLSEAKEFLTKSQKISKSVLDLSPNYNEVKENLAKVEKELKALEEKQNSSKTKK